VRHSWRLWHNFWFSKAFRLDIADINRSNFFKFHVMRSQAWSCTPAIELRPFIFAKKYKMHTACATTNKEGTTQFQEWLTVYCFLKSHTSLLPNVSSNVKTTAPSQSVHVLNYISTTVCFASFHQYSTGNFFFCVHAQKTR